MKKLILAISFVAGLVVMASAQMSHRSPEQRATHITKVLQKRLQLNAGQAQQVNAAFLIQATRMDSLKSNLSADKKANHLVARSIMLGTERQIVAVLNDSQKEQFMAWVKLKKQKRVEKRNALRLNE